MPVSMRTAIVADIHGNRTAFEAVLADVRRMSPDLVLHGGDLADGGASPIEIVDHIRDLGWRGVVGNTDEMLFRPEALREFASGHPNLQELFHSIEEMAAATREALGEERLAWLQELPRSLIHDGMALVHGTPQSPWRAPSPEATDAELESIYRSLGQPVAVYAHIHRPFVRRLPELTVANTGSVGLSYDGDRRASYLLVDGASMEIRRVEYDVAKEVRNLCCCSLPHAAWVMRLVETGSFQMP
ncbi:MAG: metallophosphoesterase family protein [Rhodanobacteraceae bacterium]